jgi:LPS export ABC transporter protein LptC
MTWHGLLSGNSIKMKRVVCKQPFFSLLYLTLCCISFILSSCKNDLAEAKLITSRANVNIEKGKDVEIRYSDMGLTRIKAISKTATRYNTQKPYLEFSDGLIMYFYNQSGKVESTLTAKYATAVENSNEMTARDSVVVINDKGERLDTDELIWDEQKKIIYSNSFVKITTADEIIYGNGMMANQNFTDYEIKKISGKIKVKTTDLQ